MRLTAIVQVHLFTLYLAHDRQNSIGPGQSHATPGSFPVAGTPRLSCHSHPGFALDINPADYFQLTFQPITFDKSQVAAGEVYHTTIRGRAVCSKNIPLPVSEATITSQAVARDTTGAGYTLNPGFVIDIKPFPDKAGETFDIDVTIDLQFPSNASPGRYDVIWQPIEARAKVSFVWTDVSDYFPSEQPMGQVTLISAPASTMGQPRPRHRLLSQPAPASPRRRGSSCPGGRSRSASWW